MQQQQIGAAKFPSIDPKHWGNAVWKAMHWVAAGYPDEPNAAQKIACRRFFFGLAGMLPCAECQEHFANVLQKQAIDDVLHSGDALREWVLELHNSVNRLIGVEEQWTLESLNKEFPPAKTLPQPQPGQIEGDRTSREAQPQRRPTIVNLTKPSRGTVHARRMKQLQRRAVQGISFTGRVNAPRALLLRGNYAVSALTVPKKSNTKAPMVTNRPVSTATIVAARKPSRRRGCGCGAR